jgi:hypothetical protein
VPGFRYARLIGSLRTKPDYPFAPDGSAEAERGAGRHARGVARNRADDRRLRQKLLTDARWRPITRGRCGCCDDGGRRGHDIHRRRGRAVENPSCPTMPRTARCRGLSEDLATADPVLATATLARVADRADAPLLAAICWQAIDRHVQGLAAEIAALRA